MKKLFAVLAFALGLAGCATPEIQTQTKIVYKFVPVPVEMTEKVHLSAPPEPAVYSKLSCDAKELALMDVIQARTTELGIANARLGGIANWSLQQKGIYAQPLFTSP